MYVVDFVRGSVRIGFSGGKLYWAWLGFLVVLILSGLVAYANQFDQGLIATNMRDQISWGFYIGNFTFLVGVAAAAVMLVIPAYLYDWKPIKEIVILGELLAISAVAMCFLFVGVDVGHPERAWHLIPFVGRLNFPSSLLAWDVIVLNLYFLLNWVIVTYGLYCAFAGRQPKKAIFVPLVLISIPAALSIHTVTAFLYNGMAARPFWNASILAPRFLASAFCSGPAVVLILLQILRRWTALKIQDSALFKLAELMAYAMFINLFLLGAELFKEFYSDTEHLLFTRILFTSVHDSTQVHYFLWPATVASVIAFVLFLIPRTRKNFWTMNLGAVLIFFGVYFEKGMGLVIPGLTPDTLGEIYLYTPNLNELRISAGIFALGFLLFTLMVKVAVPILLGEFRYGRPVRT